jgi:hypothetical protein
MNMPRMLIASLFAAAVVIIFSTTTAGGSGPDGFEWGAGVPTATAMPR